METELIQIDVTEEDLRSGRIMGAWDCPVAIGIRRVLQAKLHPNIEIAVTSRHFSIYFQGADGLVCIEASHRLPQSAEDLAFEFDWHFQTGKMPSPLTFEIELSIEMLKTRLAEYGKTQS